MKLRFCDCAACKMVRRQFKNHYHHKNRYYEILKRAARHNAKVMLKQGEYDLPTAISIPFDF